ncbi:hypothetical protein ZWY2020_021661 [Hordeum vulgare]|nr:hypothetical protein ZWY2020_021661 [Hordeum vulgare]
MLSPPSACSPAAASSLAPALAPSLSQPFPHPAASPPLGLPILDAMFSSLAPERAPAASKNVEGKRLRHMHADVAEMPLANTTPRRRRVRKPPPRRERSCAPGHGCTLEEEGSGSRRPMVWAKDCVFFFEDFFDNDTFVLGIHTDWQLQHMIQYGNRSLLASDSKFGTNKLKYPVHSILVFDQQKNAIPVAWIITPNFTHGEIHRWMGALYDRVCTKGPTWQLGGFIIDDPLTDVRTIREVFLCPVLISLWRVRHAWHKKLMNKCSDFERRSMMSKRLGEAISSICRGNSDIELFQAFLEDFIDCSGFVDYFKALWFPRLGASVLKTNPLATAEVASAIERYHHLLKLLPLNEADESIYQRQVVGSQVGYKGSLLLLVG